MKLVVTAVLAAMTLAGAIAPATAEPVSQESRQALKDQGGFQLVARRIERHRRHRVCRIRRHRRVCYYR